jgi:SAM-dependent methyltransferase
VSPSSPDLRPLRFDDAADFQRLADVLKAADYTDRGVAALLGLGKARDISDRDLPWLLRATEPACPQATLIRLFLMGVAVAADEVQRAAAPMDLASWRAAGLVEIDGDEVRATVQLLPHRELVLAFDMPRHDRPLHPNHVMGVGASTLTLANLTVRHRSSLTLDLGCGCGFQAFLAAPHSDHVAAVDLNPRAVYFAEFNARLNGLANVECLQGSFFGPVEGRRFDLVVSNPPFVISPEARYIYRDAGMRADELARSIVCQVPPLLNEGGFCQVLCNWAHVAGQDGRERLAAWFAGTGCDAWVMSSDTLDAASYAAKWIKHTERDDSQGYAERFKLWTAYYERERIEAVSGGLITVRRRSGGQNWFQADEAPPSMFGDAGDSVLRRFALLDFLQAAPSDQALLAGHFLLSPDARLQQRFAPGDDGWTPVESQIQLMRGLGYSGEVDPLVADLLARCNGQRPLGELLAAWAVRLGQPLDKIAGPALAVIRRLIEHGFLLPVDVNNLGLAR